MNLLKRQLKAISQATGGNVQAKRRRNECTSRFAGKVWMNRGRRRLAGSAGDGMEFKLGSGTVFWEASGV